MLKIKLPTSPWNTRQEQLREDPWQMLIVCMMLNQTSYKQVEKIRYRFFELYPMPEDLLAAPDQEIIDLIRPLGFYNRRVSQWKQFSRQWLTLTSIYKDPKIIPVEELEDLTGVGKYALDSWKIFQLFDYSIEPEDHVLNWYIDWARQEVERIERDMHAPKPILIYFLPYYDEREMDRAWTQYQSHVCCIMARTFEEAKEKTRKIMSHVPHLKWMGQAYGKLEWVNEFSDLQDNTPRGGKKQI